jgi:hypothetical protein
MATTPTGKHAHEAADRLTEWLRRSNGANAIADYMDKEAIVTILEHNEALRAALGRHDGCSRMSNADRLLLTVREEPPPFGAVRFDGDRQHYAHRDQIPLYGSEGAWAIAQKQFNEQSGGAAL